LICITVSSFCCLTIFEICYIFGHSSSFLYVMFTLILEAGDSVFDWGTILQARGSWVQFLMRQFHFVQFNNSFQSHLGAGVCSSCNRNEYQESSLGVKQDRHIRETTLPPYVSRCLENVGASTSHNSLGLHSLLKG
jgi:hypothetical protein